MVLAYGIFIDDLSHVFLADAIHHISHCCGDTSMLHGSNGRRTLVRVIHRVLCQDVERVFDLV